MFIETTIKFNVTDSEGATESREVKVSDDHDRILYTTASTVLLAQSELTPELLVLFDEPALRLLEEFYAKPGTRSVSDLMSHLVVNATQLVTVHPSQKELIITRSGKTEDDQLGIADLSGAKVSVRGLVGAVPQIIGNWLEYLTTRLLSPEFKKQILNSPDIGELEGSSFAIVITNLKPGVFYRDYSTWLDLKLAWEAMKDGEVDVDDLITKQRLLYGEDEQVTLDQIVPLIEPLTLVDFFEADQDVIVKLADGHTQAMLRLTMEKFGLTNED